MILKGQNFRVLIYDATLRKYKCIAMATSNTINLNANTEDASTKDDVGIAGKPTVVSKNWQVSVESLDVMDAAAILDAIKSCTPFTLLWDEVSTTDNQTALTASISRQGQAYLSDVTFTFNDRENSSKSLQFIGTGELTSMLGTMIQQDIILPLASGYTKGQFVRLFLGGLNGQFASEVIAAAKQLSFHVSMSFENATTKDTNGDWQIQDPVSINYDISTTALIRGGDDITSTVGGKSISDLQYIYENSAPVKFQIANVEGANQRTKAEVIVSGSVVITSLTLNGPNRKNADYSAALNGYGIYSVGS